MTVHSSSDKDNSALFFNRRSKRQFDALSPKFTFAPRAPRQAPDGQAVTPQTNTRDLGQMLEYDLLSLLAKNGEMRGQDLVSHVTRKKTTIPISIRSLLSSTLGTSALIY